MKTIVTPTGASILDEGAFPLSEAPNHWPRKNGKNVHKSLIYRAYLHGIDGIRLEVLVVGRRLYTSKSAINRFLVAVTARRLAAKRVVAPDALADAVLTAGGIALRKEGA